MTITITADSNNLVLAHHIAQALNAKFVTPTITRFADGEIEISYTDATALRGTTVCIVHTTTLPVHDALMQLLLMADAVRKAGASSITAIIPYLGYARHNIDKQTGKPGSFGLIAQLLETAGIQQMVTVAPHMPDIQAFFTIPVHVIDPTPCIAEHIKSSVDLTDAYIVAPDKGAQERACALAHSLGIGHLSFDKIRHAPNAVRIVTSSPAQARGTTAIIVDDILDTGSTVQAVAQSLRKTEFVTIVGYFIHAVCSTNPHEHLLAQDLNAITVTNTLPQSQTSYGATIDLNPLIVHTVCKLFNHPKDME